MIESDRIDQIFKQMDEYVLELASDSKDLGPQYFQDKISICRNYLNNVSLIVSELNREKLATSAEIRRLEALYELEYDTLLATDELVRKLASIEDRKSTVKHMLRGQKKEIDILKDNLHAVDAVFKVVNHRSRELHATMNEIRDQRRLIQAELRSGSFYGDERPTKLTHSDPEGGFDVEDINAEELDALLDSAGEKETSGAEQSASEEQTEAQAKEAAPEHTEAQETAPEQTEAQTEAQAKEAAPEHTEAPEPEKASELETKPESDPEEAAVQRFLDGPSTASDKEKTHRTSEDAEIAELLENL